MKIFNNSIPVIAYHQVGKSSKITPEIFNEQMKYLHDAGYKAVSIDEFYRYITGKQKAAGKKILITFDDGFTDNFVHAYPILKKYGFTAAIFLITSRINITDEIRYNADDLAAGRCTESELYETNLSTQANIGAAKNGATDDFLNSAEINKMFRDGTIEFESHTHLHAKCFSDNKIRGFFSPTSHWVVLFETRGKLDYGAPVYTMSSAVCKKRFFDDKGLREFLVEYVRHSGGGFFEEADRSRRLHDKVTEYKANHRLNERYETDEEYVKRVTDDLVRSKEVIARITGKESEYLCLPWGESSPELVRIAKRCGFKGIFSLQRGANSAGSDPYNIKRLEVKPKGMRWFKARVRTYSSGIKSNLYQMIRS